MALADITMVLVALPPAVQAALACAAIARRPVWSGPPRPWRHTWWHPSAAGVAGPAPMASVTASCAPCPTPTPARSG